jgi:hypothetical protein
MLYFTDSRSSYITSYQRGHIHLLWPKLRGELHTTGHEVGYEGYWGIILIGTRYEDEELPALSAQ